MNIVTAWFRRNFANPQVVLLATLLIAGFGILADIWGFCGIFFAIPLASLMHAVLNAWPRAR
jgi:putative permease